MLTNSAPPNALPLHTLPATPAQLARLLKYQRDQYSPIAFEQLPAGRLRLTLERLASCSNSGRRWSGRIELTIDNEGKVIGSTVLPAEVVQPAAAIPIPKLLQRTDEPEPDQPAPRRRKSAKSKAAPTQTDAPQFWPNQLVRIPSGQRAWVDQVLGDGKVAVTVEGVGNDIYPAYRLTPVETEPPAPEPEPTMPTYQPGQRVRFIGSEHDELAGTLGTIEQVGGARLLVRSDDAGLVTVGADEVELVEEQPRPSRSRKKVS